MKKINDEIIKFIEKYKDDVKYFLLEEGFVNFEFLIEGDKIEIDLKEIEIDNKMINFKNYEPIKLTMAGNMMIQGNYLMYTKYDDKMIFVLV